jgi:hypothetical protein
LTLVRPHRVPLGKGLQCLDAFLSGGNEMQLLAVVAKGIGEPAATKFDGVANNRIEHRLDFGSRLGACG